MRHPSEYFIKYLLADQGAGQPAAWFTRQLREIGLPPITQEQLDTIRAAMNIPPIFQPRNPVHQDSISFLRHEKIHGLFYPDRNTQLAQDILNNRIIRDKLEALLLGRHSDLAAAKLTEKATEEKISAKVVSLYRHYFFNVDLLSSEELASCLYQHTTDWNMKSSALFGGPDVAAFRVGIRRRLDSREILLTTQSILFHKLLEADRMRLDLNNAQILALLTRGIVDVDNRLSQGDVAIKEVLEKFKEFRITHAKEEKVTPVRQLTKGRYTGSGQEVYDLVPVSED
jgi:hypothetical protein